MDREQELTEEQLISELEKESAPTEKEFVTVRLKGSAMNSVLGMQNGRTPSETANMLVMLGVKKFQENRNRKPTISR